jgi:hypothetical protein
MIDVKQQSSLLVQAEAVIKLLSLSELLWLLERLTQRIRELAFSRIASNSKSNEIQHLDIATYSKNDKNVDQISLAPLEPPEPLSTEKLQALGFGAFKDDPTLDSLFDEIERQRDAHTIGGDV